MTLEPLFTILGSLLKPETLFGAAGAVLLIFLTPLGRHFVERRFSRKPVFLIRSPILRSDLFLTVEALNSVAKKLRPLGISFNGFIIPQIANPTRIGGKIIWQVNLSKARDINLLVREGTVSVQFFHDVDQKSDPIPLRYDPEDPHRENALESRAFESDVQSIEELLLELRSNSKISAIFAQASVTSAFPLETPNLKWITEFDGSELQVIGVTNLEIIGNGCEVLADPRYAYVLTFRDCHGVKLRRMTLGHSKPGYCVGGVLRFINCSDVQIEDCDLFGCGTHGLDFQDTHLVNVTRSIIRNCTYGIMLLKDVRQLTFADCRFFENREFDLIPIQGYAESVAFERCEFVSNYSKGNLFDFEGASGNSQIRLTECAVEGNKFVAISNKLDLVSIDSPIPRDNYSGDPHWLRRRRG